MPELIVRVVLYAFPIVALPFVLRADPVSRRLSSLSFLVAPLVGVATYLVLTGEASLSAAAAILPFAFLPLSFWAAFLAALATPILRRAYDRSRFGTFAFILSSAASGALVGGAFMLGFSALVAKVEAPGSIDLWRHVVCGLAAGAFAAAVGAWTLVSRGQGRHDRMMAR